jgi:UDPglucose 6-dehydrogenase
VSKPTNYDEKTNFFDTSSVEAVVKQAVDSEPDACTVTKSTIPVEFIEDVRARLDTDVIIFLPSSCRKARDYTMKYIQAA